MSLIMTKQEREAFLAGVHIGIISIAEEGRGPLTVPIWYAYDLGGDVRIMTGRESRRGDCSHAPADSASVCRPKVRLTSTSVWRAPSFLLKRPMSSAICARSPAVISEKKRATGMLKRRETYLRMPTMYLSECARNDG